MPQARSAGTILLKRQAQGQRDKCHYSLLGTLSKASGPLSHVPTGLRAQSSLSSLSYVCPFQGSSVIGNGTRGAKGFYCKQPERKNVRACLVAAWVRPTPKGLSAVEKVRGGL